MQQRGKGLVHDKAEGCPSPFKSFAYFTTSSRLHAHVNYLLPAICYAQLLLLIWWDEIFAITQYFYAIQWWVLLTITAVNSRLGSLPSVCFCCLRKAARAKLHLLKNNSAILIIPKITKPHSIHLFGCCSIRPILRVSDPPAERECPHRRNYAWRLGCFPVLDGLQKANELNVLCLLFSFLVFKLGGFNTLFYFTLLYAEPSKKDVINRVLRLS